mmetsp:Transcript_1412/g.5039  ORF Transcript_1412/g.5039 Transcript_1412/m.5039 type:complete len:344 (+) Transcript_1412:359-1390(+)
MEGSEACGGGGGGGQQPAALLPLPVRRPPRHLSGAVRRRDRGRVQGQGSSRLLGGPCQPPRIPRPRCPAPRREGALRLEEGDAAGREGAWRLAAAGPLPDLLRCPPRGLPRGGVHGGGDAREDAPPPLGQSRPPPPLSGGRRRAARHRHHAARAVALLHHRSDQRARGQGTAAEERRVPAGGARGRLPGAGVGYVRLPSARHERILGSAEAPPPLRRGIGGGLGHRRRRPPGGVAPPDAQCDQREGRRRPPRALPRPRRRRRSPQGSLPTPLMGPRPLQGHHPRPPLAERRQHSRVLGASAHGAAAGDGARLVQSIAGAAARHARHQSPPPHAPPPRPGPGIP